MIFLLFTPNYTFSQSQQHYTYITNQNKVADLFHDNKPYYQCKTAQHCVPGADGSPTRKKLAIFLLDQQTGIVVPTFIQCYENGDSMASMAESLVPIVNETLSNDPCATLENYQGSVPRRFITDTMQALDNYDEEGCPLEDRSCGQQIYDLLEKDLKNLIRPFSSQSAATTEMGCLSTLIANMVDGLWSTVKLVAWDLPRGIWNTGVNAWNYFFNQEADTSTAMLYASVMSEGMASALSRGDLSKFYSELRTNFFGFLGAIREFYSELMGCNEWSGIPFQSECLNKTNWSCPTCESTTNFLCGLTGQIGSGLMLGALLGVAKAGATLAKYKQSVSRSPEKYGIVSQALTDLKARQSVQAMKRGKEHLLYQTRQAMSPVTNFFKAATGEMKMLFTLGENVKNLMAINPVTAPFHLAFQSGARASQHLIQNLAVDGRLAGLSLSPSLNLSRRYGQSLTKIQESFADKLADLHRMRGQNINPTIIADIERRYLADVKFELDRLNIKSTISPDGRGLILEKGGDSFTYNPNLRQKIEDTPSGMSLDDFKSFMTNNDPLLDTITPSNRLLENTPSFFREVRTRGDSAASTFVTKSGATDGYVYLSYFTAQSKSVPDNKNCDDLLYQTEVVRVHDVTPEPSP
jgi:hypothetical protein